MLEELLKEDGILQVSETEYFYDEVVIKDLKESTSQINQYNREAKRC